MSNRTVRNMLVHQAKAVVLAVLNPRAIAGNIEPVAENELDLKITRFGQGVRIAISAPCFEGSLTVFRNGDVSLIDDVGEFQSIYGQVYLATLIKFMFKLYKKR